MIFRCYQVVEILRGVARGELVGHNNSVNAVTAAAGWRTVMRIAVSTPFCQSHLMADGCGIGVQRQNEHYCSELRWRCRHCRLDARTKNSSCISSSAAVKSGTQTQRTQRSRFRQAISVNLVIPRVRTSHGRPIGPEIPVGLVFPAAFKVS